MKVLFSILEKLRQMRNKIPAGSCAIEARTAFLQIKSRQLKAAKTFVSLLHG
jgi:hypothetical protein